MQTKFALVLLTTGVLLIQIMVAISVYLLLPTWAERGQFGDLFGSINALFSGLAFAALIYTVHLQRKELQLQRVELQMTRAELSRSAEAQEKSERALSSQAFAMQVAAEISAINNLLTHIHSELSQMTADSSGLTIYRNEIETLRKQRTNLLKNLNTLYSESVSARLRI